MQKLEDAFFPSVHPFAPVREGITTRDAPHRVVRLGCAVKHMPACVAPSSSHRDIPDVTCRVDPGTLAMQAWRVGVPMRQSPLERCILQVAGQRPKGTSKPATRNRLANEERLARTSRPRPIIWVQGRVKALCKSSEAKHGIVPENLHCGNIVYLKLATACCRERCEQTHVLPNSTCTSCER